MLKMLLLRLLNFKCDPKLPFLKPNMLVLGFLAQMSKYSQNGIPVGAFGK